MTMLKRVKSFFNSKPETPPEQEPAPFVSIDPGHATLVSKVELQHSFSFTETLIIESVTAKLSSDPVFKDEYLYLSHRLKANPHPAVLKLIDYGSENGKLYRAWERRNFRSIFNDNPHSTPNDPKAKVLQILDGFKHLLALDLPVWDLRLPQFVSADKDGFFVARLPLTLKAVLNQPTESFFTPPRQMILLDLFMEPEFFDTELKSESAGAQFQMGSFCWVILSRGALPYSTHPGYARRFEVPVERVDHDFPQPLNDVLYRLTELDPQKRYPSFEEGLAELEWALNLQGPPHRKT